MKFPGTGKELFEQNQNFSGSQKELFGHDKVSQLRVIQIKA